MSYFTFKKVNLEKEDLKSVQLLKTYTVNPFNQRICGLEYGLGSM